MSGGGHSFLSAADPASLSSEITHRRMQTARVTCSLALARRVARGVQVRHNVECERHPARLLSRQISHHACVCALALQQAARPAVHLPNQFAGAYAAQFSGAAVRSRACRRLLSVTRASDAAAEGAPAAAAPAGASSGPIISDSESSPSCSEAAMATSSGHGDLVSGIV